MIYPKLNIKYPGFFGAPKPSAGIAASGCGSGKEKNGAGGVVSLERLVEGSEFRKSA